MRHDHVMRACQSRYGVEQNDHVLAVLHQPLGLLDDHVGDLYVPICGLIERRADHFGLHVLLHVGDLFGSLIDEQHDQRHLRVILQHRVGDFLHDDRLARARWRDDQAPLAFADRRDDVHHSHAGVAVQHLQPQPLVGI